MSGGNDLVAQVRASGTSFYWGIRLLPRARRQAMAALYLFCRAVDDIVDDPGPTTPEERRSALEAWRDSLHGHRPAPNRAIGDALTEACRAFGVPVEPLEAILDGMAMDLPPGLIAPPRATLDLYCARVAGAVGLVSVRLFGARAPAADAFALTTGEALQYTNILRDLSTDAALRRLYLPREVLDAHGIADRDPMAALAHPALPAACAAFAAEAAERFTLAVDMLRALPAEDRAALRPAALMLALYRDLFDRLEARGWALEALDRAPPRAGTWRRLGLVVRHRVLGP